VILGTAGLRFDPIHQRPGLIGAQIDFSKAFEQFQA
jgi:hypothetical protein